MFLVSNCIRFWFELVNQKMVEMELNKMAHLMAHLPFLVIFHLKVIVCQILIFHIFMLIKLKKPIRDMKMIKLFTWFTNLFQSY